MTQNKFFLGRGFFENRVLKKEFGPKGMRYKGSGEDYVTWSLMLCTPHQILFGWQNQEGDG